MAVVEVSFSAVPVHVRTARMIVTAVARRSGVEETLLDEVRLAVGEACSRAVEAHQRFCPAEPVRMEMTDKGHRFEVVVSDSASGDGDRAEGVLPLSVPGDETASAEQDGGLDDWTDPLLDGSFDLGLAVIAGLADDVVISSTPKGVEIRMSWPTDRP